MLRAEKSACEKIEYEYNQVLAQKQQLLDAEQIARLEAEQRYNELEIELAGIQGMIEAAVQERTSQRQEEMTVELEMQKR
jgi:hypothetical protein